MRQIGQRQPLLDAPLEEQLDACHGAHGKLARIGSRTLAVRNAGSEEHQLGRFVARRISAVPEEYLAPGQRPRAALDRFADGLGRACVG